MCENRRNNLLISMLSNSIGNLRIGRELASHLRRQRMPPDFVRSRS